MDKSSLEALIKWLEIWSAIFGVIVVVGVAGESFFGVRLLWNNWKLQRIEAAESEKLRAEIAEAGKREAEINLEIAKLKTPRTLSAEQQTGMVLKLRAVAGQKFSLAVGQDPEQLSLLAEIRNVLLAAGWVKTPPAGFGDISIGDAALGFGTGVVVRLASNADSATRDAANLLAGALNSDGIASRPEVDARVPDPSILNVLVGVKPMR